MRGYILPPPSELPPVPTTRVQRFQAGEFARVRDTGSSLYGRVVAIARVFLDPMPMEFAHCAGRSARYTATNGTPEGVTLYDWQLTKP